MKIEVTFYMDIEYSEMNHDYLIKANYELLIQGYKKIISIVYIIYFRI